MGRPPVEFDSEQIKQVEHLAAVLTQVQIADFFGISDNTLRKIMERQEEVSSAYKRGKAKAIATVATNLITQAKNGNTASAIFYLKTQAGWKETDRRELTGPDGEPLQVEEIKRVVIDPAN